MTMTEQNSGNYIRLVNKCRNLQWEITVNNKMIELMAESSAFDDTLDLTPIIEMYREQALSELVTEQNKKAADNASI